MSKKQKEELNLLSEIKEYGWDFKIFETTIGGRNGK